MKIPEAPPIFLVLLFSATSGCLAAVTDLWFAMAAFFGLCSLWAITRYK